MGGEKLAAAKTAGIAFIRAMRLPDDRVGIASFSSDSHVVHGLSGDADELEAIIETLEVSPGTRIDRGLEAGLAVLAAARDDVTPVLILLTDGIQDAAPEAPTEVAQRVRDADIILHIIGLGPDVDADYLRSVVGPSERLHLSPGTEDLEAIYTGIAWSVPCPTEAYWGRR